MIRWEDPVTYVGITGVVLVLFSIYRTSIGRWTNKSFWYELDVVFGASMVAFYQLHVGAYVTVVTNIAYAVVAFRGLTSFAERYTVKKKRTSRKKPKR